MSDEQIMCALIGQVAAAAGGQVESSVETRISRPMWRAWCRAVKVPEDSEPTEWLGIHKTLRVYGSRTVIVESEEMFAASFKP